MDGALKLRAKNRLGELLRGKREATDYARMSIDQSSSVLCKLGEPDNRFEKILVDRIIVKRNGMEMENESYFLWP